MLLLIRSWCSKLADLRRAKSWNLVLKERPSLHPKFVRLSLNNNNNNNNNNKNNSVNNNDDIIIIITFNKLTKNEQQLKL